MEQLEESKRQLVKERDLKYEEADKELKQVKLEVESKRSNLEARQKIVEAIVAEVLFHYLLQACLTSCSLIL